MGKEEVGVIEWFELKTFHLYNTTLNHTLTQHKIISINSK